MGNENTCSTVCCYRIITLLKFQRHPTEFKHFGIDFDFHLINIKLNYILLSQTKLQRHILDITFPVTGFRESFQ